MILRLAFRALILAGLAGTGHAAADPQPLQLYRLSPRADESGYDETVALATIQGIVNRDAPELYVLAAERPREITTASRANYWLELLSRDGEWLAGRPQRPVNGLDQLVQLAGPRLKGVVIWDPAVPATLNVATTIAGVRDAVVLSPELAAKHLSRWRLPVLEDLRGRFSGAETGSAKNDAYRWAIREYLAPGRCSSRFLCLFADPFTTRAKGEIGYAITRDWAVKHRAFVLDLSPWADEQPADDRGQRLGLDVETYRMILAETLRQSGGRHLTELTGFFVFEKYSHFGGNASRHEPVPTEWETVHLISPYNVFQNTVSDHCYNQSLHSHAPRPPLRQNRTAQPRPLEPKAYVCIFMADYDSSSVLYDVLPRNWDDPNRGKLPLAWGINPNLRDTYPDVVEHFYRTLTPADTITADAGAAGYMNPSRIPAEQLPLFVRHNLRYFREADLDLAPMVLDWRSPSAAVKDAFREFAPAGFGSMVWDMHTNTGDPVTPHVWRGLTVLRLRNEANEFPGAAATAEIIAETLCEESGQRPGFFFFRIVWQNPSRIIEMLDALRAKHPDLPFEVVDIHTFFALAKQHYQSLPPTPIPTP